jgi:hypothetical protein
MAGVVSFALMARRDWHFSRRAQWTLFFTVVALSLVSAHVTGSLVAAPIVAIAGAILAWFLERRYPRP